MNPSTRAKQIAQSAYGHATQDPLEFACLLDKVLALAPRIVLEVGVSFGGTLTAWGKAASGDALLIGVDCDISPARVYHHLGQRSVLIEGDSAAEGTLDAVESLLNGRQVDFLFVDGCHEEGPCRADLENYVPFVRSGGLVGMHDVVGNDGVKPVWAEWGLPRGGQVFFNDGQAHRMGIGVFSVP